MEFFTGLICGSGLMLTALVWQRRHSRYSGVEKPAKRAAVAPSRRAWAQTRNFLYYDGTVMPEVKHEKEDTHEQ